MTAQTRAQPADIKVRLDKWLWAARFFKTRALAAEAISGGKVHVNKLRVKPARAVQLDDVLEIRRGPYEITILVKGLSNQRGPAKAAALLYEETPQSVARRNQLAEQRRLQTPPVPQPPRRPSKRDRRHIIRFQRKSDST